MSESNALAVQTGGLDYYFGRGDLRKQVLFDINLELPKGQIVILTRLGLAHLTSNTAIVQ